MLVVGILYYVAIRSIHVSVDRPKPTPKRIDMVYTWVNGGDPHWRAQKQKYCPDESNARFSPPSAPDAELETSLLLSLQNLPFISKIFIVTDNQRPRCLDLNPKLHAAARRGKIQVVDHAVILPFRPVFNSLSIEAQLHKIPGLAEHFLYANDDFFVVHKLDYTTFYDKQMRPRFSGMKFTNLVKNMGLKRKNLREPTKMYVHLAKLLEQHRQKCYVPGHRPLAMTKSLMTEMHKAYPRWMKSTSLCRKRDGDKQIPPIAAALCLGLSQRTVVYDRFPRRGFIFAKYLLSGSTPASLHIVKNFINPSFVCFNDLDDSNCREMTHQLQALYLTKD